MINPLGALKGLGDINQLRQQAKRMQDLLKQEEITVEKDGVKIVMRGDQHVKMVEVDGIVENKEVKEDVDQDLKQVVISTRDKVIAKMDELRVADAITEIFTLSKSFSLSVMFSKLALASSTHSAKYIKV